MTLQIFNLLLLRFRGFARYIVFGHLPNELVKLLKAGVPICGLFAAVVGLDYNS